MKTMHENFIRFRKINRGISMADLDLISRLSKLDTCAVSDAIDLLGLTGTVIGIRPMWSCNKVIGRAVTVQLGPKGSRESSRHLGTTAIESAFPGDIIVVDHRGRTDVAGWGGILSIAANVKGLAGVIVDGACRDVDECKEMGFPVYARAPVPLTARGRVVEYSCNEEIIVGGVSVKPGDLVIADGSGVVFVRSDKAEEIISQAEVLAQKEAQMAKAVKSGTPVGEVMGGNYETMLNKG
jgi:4-hydroxy-4-methyl-2-oxoglutarate aldolase